MLPDRIKIGGTMYAVRCVPELHDGDAKLSGWYREGDSELLIDAALAPQSAYQTLWHEILHGVLTAAGRSEQPEGFIETVSFGVVMVLRDNPALLDSLRALEQR